MLENYVGISHHLNWNSVKLSCFHLAKELGKQLCPIDLRSSRPNTVHGIPQYYILQVRRQLQPTRTHPPSPLRLQSFCERSPIWDFFADGFAQVDVPRFFPRTYAANNASQDRLRAAIPSFFSAPDPSVHGDAEIGLINEAIEIQVPRFSRLPF